MEKLKISKEQIIEFLKGIGTIALFYLLMYGIQIILILIIRKNNTTTSNIIMITTYTIALLVLGFIYRKEIVNDFNNFKREYLITALKYWFIGICLMIMSNLIITKIAGGIATNESLNRENIALNPLGSILTVGILGPFIEELTFRASFKKAFKSSFAFSLTTSLIFGLAHIAKFSLTEFLFIIPYSSLGFFFAKAYYETNNIFTSYIAHLFHNTVNIFLLLLLLG